MSGCDGNSCVNGSCGCGRKDEFCHFCGASIPHRPGEGRCPKCVHIRPETEPKPPWERP